MSPFITRPVSFNNVAPPAPRDLRPNCPRAAAPSRRLRRPVAALCLHEGPPPGHPCGPAVGAAALARRWLLGRDPPRESGPKREPREPQ
eukprot:scaffold37992_cov60-Phaeocystis_antarctica.AAC.6